MRLDGPMEAIYHELADVYARLSSDNAVNAHYDRPEILRLAGDLRGRSVLELGCAAGALTERLVDAGASVLAIDREPRMIDHAVRRLGSRAAFTVADLEEPWSDVPTDGVDVVVASLVLHYVADWGPVLAEVARCLRPGGHLVFSVHHPITGWNLSAGSDYHAVELICEDWSWEGRPVTAQMYRRSFSAIFGDLARAGFAVDAVTEPVPQTLPDQVDDGVRRALLTSPVFLFVRATLRDA